MKKVLHLIHGLNAGGAEVLVSNYFLRFKNHEVEYTLLCLEHRNEFSHEEQLKRAGVKVIYVEDYLPFKKNTNRVCKLINSIARYYYVRRIILRYNPDIIHTHLRINSFLRFAKPKRDTIIFLTVHSDPEQIWGSKKYVRDYRAVKWLVKKYHTYFIVLHKEMANKIKGMFNPFSITLLNNGVDVKRIKNINNKEKTKKTLGIPKDAFVVGHIGRFCEVKNQGFLVDIFIEIAKKNKKAYLLLIGDGPDKPKIFQKLKMSKIDKKSIVLSNRSDIPDLLGVMDVFVFPSLYEGIPLSLIEAQIARKNCFVSDKVNKYAIISNLVSIISLNQSAEQWGDAILENKIPEKIILDEKNWDIDEITSKLEQLYLNALKDRKNGKEQD